MFWDNFWKTKGTTLYVFLSFQVWHWCVPSIRGNEKYSFICAPGTVFSQRTRVCDYFYKVTSSEILIAWYFLKDMLRKASNNFAFVNVSRCSLFWCFPSPCVELSTTCYHYSEREKQNCLLWNLRLRSCTSTPLYPFRGWFYFLSLKFGENFVYTSGLSCALSVSQRVSHW